LKQNSYLLKKILIDYNGKLFNGWINGNLTVSEATSLWNIVFEAHDYYEYDGKLIDQNLSITQIKNLFNNNCFASTIKYFGLFLFVLPTYIPSIFSGVP
jgi:hypothetical protein